MTLSDQFDEWTKVRDYYNSDVRSSTHMSDWEDLSESKKRRIRDSYRRAVTAAPNDVLEKPPAGPDYPVTTKADMVAHPAHYTSSPAKCSGCGKPIECIDITKHMNFSVGSMIKYLWRLGLKGDRVEQLRKVIQYAEFEIGRIEGEQHIATDAEMKRAMIDYIRNGS
jgi:hypothetical protein